MKNFMISLWMLFGLMLERFMVGFGLIKCIDLYDIEFASGQDNTGGMTQTFYFAYAEDILTWPTYKSKALAADQDELMNYEGNFIMKPGKKFYKGYCSQDTGEVRWEAQGPFDGKSFKHMFEIFRPSADAKTLGFLDMVKNANMVFIARDRDGNWRVVGSEFMSAKLESGSGTTGKTAEDAKGDTMVFSTSLESPPKFYPGTIPLTEASS